MFVIDSTKHSLTKVIYLPLRGNYKMYNKI